MVGAAYCRRQSVPKRLGGRTLQSAVLQGHIQQRQRHNTMLTMRSRALCCRPGSTQLWRMPSGPVSGRCWPGWLHCVFRRPVQRGWRGRVHAVPCGNLYRNTRRCQLPAVPRWHIRECSWQHDVHTVQSWSAHAAHGRDSVCQLLLGQIPECHRSSRVSRVHGRHFRSGHKRNRLQIVCSGTLCSRRGQLKL